MTDGGRHVDLKYRSAARHRAAYRADILHAASGIRAIPDALATLQDLAAYCVADFGNFAMLSKGDMESGNC